MIEKTKFSNYMYYYDLPDMIFGIMNGTEIVMRDMITKTVYCLDPFLNTYQIGGVSWDTEDFQNIRYEDERAIRTALAIAKDAHEGQKDKGGNDYILHPITVFKTVKGGNPVACKIVAALHDVVEDTDVTLMDLWDVGYSKEIVDSINAITRRDAETYDAYIKRVEQDDTAMRVKLADLCDNSDLSRLHRQPTEDELKRVEKYKHYIAEIDNLLGMKA